MMIRSTARMLLPHQKYGEVLRILRLIVEQSRVLPGCMSSRLYKDLEEKNTILIEGIWLDQESLESYLRSEEYHKLLLVAELSLEHPEIKFDTISESTGIETIKKARHIL